MCFLGVFFGVSKREKRRERLGERKISENVCPLPYGVCLGLFIASGMKIDTTTIVRLLMAF